MLGGSGQRVTLSRALTEIEQNVVDAVVKVILENLSETWASIVPVRFRINGRETRPQMLQVAPPTESMILLVFDIRVSDARGMLNLCIPTSVIDTFGASFTQGWYRTRRQPSTDERSALFENLGRVPLACSALLETTLPARELLRLRVGDIMSLGQALNVPLRLRVGNVDQFEGRPIKNGAKAAIEITAASGAGDSIGDQA
jgi:flagellar motor switch protein FliM